MAELMPPVYQICHLLTKLIELFCLVLRLNIRNATHFPVNILRTLLHPDDIIKNLAMWFDADFCSQNTFRRLVKPASSRCVTLVKLDSTLITHEVVILLQTPLSVVI